MARYAHDIGAFFSGHGDLASGAADSVAPLEVTVSPFCSSVPTMNDRQSNRGDLLNGIARSLGRRLSVYTALYHAALADQLGLNMTDLNALDLILELESVTAGQLAELMSVSSGGITTVIDRLERAGFVEREKDPSDRRIVVVHPVAQRCEEISRFLSSITREITAISAAYDHNELAAIHDFLVQSIRTLKSETLRLRIESHQSGTPNARKPKGELKSKSSS